jgi:hypothetical protein
MKRFDQFAGDGRGWQLVAFIAAALVVALIPGIALNGPNVGALGFAIGIAAVPSAVAAWRLRKGDSTSRSYAIAGAALLVIIALSIKGQE